jgi:hypothetical protein
VVFSDLDINTLRATSYNKDLDMILGVTVSERILGALGSHNIDITTIK